MTKDEVRRRIVGLAFDVNPAEIAGHIQDDTLREWCHNWKQKMIEEASLILLTEEHPAVVADEKGDAHE
jgi:hypothetical protein